MVHHDAHWLITTGTPRSCASFARIVLSRIRSASRTLAARTVRAVAPAGALAARANACDEGPADGRLGALDPLEATITAVTAPSTSSPDAKPI